MDLRRREGPMLCVGHRGAAALEPENTLRSFARAVELGVDLIEFDVLALEDGTLVVAHSNDLHEVSHGAGCGTLRGRSLVELRKYAPELPILGEALAFFADHSSVGLHIDLKWYDLEAVVVEAIRAYGLVDRTLVSSPVAASVRRVAGLEPRLLVGLTYPFDRRGMSRRPVLAPLVAGALRALRQTLPRRVTSLLADAGATVAVLHHSVISPAAVARAHAVDAAVVAWTVDDPHILRRMDEAGVDALVTNDPRIARATLRT